MLLAMPALVGCSDAADAADAAGVTPTATGAAGASSSSSYGSSSSSSYGADQVTVTTTLTSASNQLATVGPGTPKVYGWNLLQGTGTLQGVPVNVTLQGSVNYVGGAGPFEGFVTLAAADGSGTLALRLDGNAAPAADGSATALDGRLDYIGGTGGYLNVVAGGMFHASRKSGVGSPVETSLELTVEADGAAGAATGSSTATQ